MFYGLSLILLGVLSAAGFIVEKRPDAKEHIEKLAKYQGYIGVAAAVWGAVVLLQAFFGMPLLTRAPVWWLTWVAIGAVLLGNGFLLGYGLAVTWVKDEKAKEHAKEVYQKLVPYQTKLGLVAIGLGTWGIICSFIWLP